MPSFERFSKGGLVMIVVSLTSYLSLPRRLGGTEMKSPRMHDVALTRKKSKTWHLIVDPGSPCLIGKMICTFSTPKSFWEEQSNSDDKQGWVTSKKMDVIHQENGSRALHNLRDLAIVLLF